MSASEKLKTLHFDPVSIFNSPTALLSLTDALPQIVAVVEAAEQARDAMGTAFSLKPKTEWARLRDTLSSLDEELP